MWQGARALAAALVIAAAWISGPVVAQAQSRSHIEKITNKRLSGTAYLRLNGLSYAACEARCLAEPECKALEHFRGSRGLFGRSMQCRLFKSAGAALPSQTADIGYKRTAVADQPMGGAKKGRAYARRLELPPPPPPPAAAPSAPRFEPRARSAAPHPVEEAARQATDRAQREVRSAPPSAPVPRSITPASPPRAGAPPPPPPVASAPPPPAASAQPSARPATRGITPVPRSIAPAPVGGGAAPPPAEWDVVPVYYGTDRNRRDLPKRIAYGADRAHKLELGRALVTVPKNHQVPNVERPWALKIPYLDVTLYQEDEDPRKHFTVQEVKQLSEADLVALVKARLAASSNYKDQALVFIHGYNNTFDDGLYRTAQIAYDLKYDGAPFLYSWPSGTGFAAYPYDRESAQQAEQYLSQFLQIVLNDTGAKSVSIIAHSMGNQPLLQVLRDLKRTNPGVAKISQIILAAPDVDRDAFAYLASQIQGVSKGVTMYASANDVALSYSRRFAGGVPRAGDIAQGFGPAVVPGIDTIDISALSTDYLALNHSNYAERTELLHDMELVLKTGTRPPDQRLPALKRIKLNNADGVYWRYTQ
jgi:esterase/lipase superfamily enzyme